MRGIHGPKDWEQDSDARTLMEADKIKGDKKRMSGAIKGAKRIEKEKVAELKSVKKIAKKKR